MAFRAGLRLAAALLAGVGAGPVHGFSAAPYFPLADGNRWVYQRDGFGSYVREVTGTAQVNGSATKALYFSPDNFYNYFTNDANGIRIHASHTPSIFISGCGYAPETDTLSPPFVYATPDIALGQVIGNAGTVSADLGYCGAYALTYAGQSNVVAQEMVSVPLGAFLAVKIVSTLNTYYQGVLNSASSETHWVAPGVGPVKSIEVDDGITETYTLSSTNVVRTAPDAFSFPPQAGVALGATIASSPIVVTGTTAAAPISIANGQYSINGGLYTSAPGTVANGQSVTVRQGAATTLATTTNATLTIGGVSAAFAVTTTTVASHTLALQVSGSGTVTSSPAGISCGSACSASFTEGTAVTLTAASALAGYVGSFSGGGCSGTISCTVTMDQARLVQVAFIPNTFTLTRIGSGTVTWSKTAPDTTYSCGATCSGNIRQGATVTLLSATPAPGYAFLGWSGAGCSGTAPCSILMNAPAAATATFAFIDSEAPSTPASLAASLAGPEAIALAWAASTDNVGVASYRIYRAMDAAAPALHAVVSGTAFTDSGLAAARSYQYSVAACDAAGNCSAESERTALFLPDTVAPSVPAGFAAIPLSDAQVRLEWSAASDNVGVAAYRLFRNGALYATLAADATGFADSGLAPATAYAYALSACDAAGNCSASRSASAATAAAGERVLNLVLEPGWNLAGNAFSAPLEVAAYFGSPAAPIPGVTEKVYSVWKWEGSQQRWAFYSPVLAADANAAYAAAYNFAPLERIAPGEGYWISAADGVRLPPQYGAANAFGPLGFAALPTGWNLLSIAPEAPLAPQRFNVDMSPVPPAPEAVPQSFHSLWQWDAAQAKWWFYSPLLEAGGGLAAVKAYAEQHGHLDFESAYPPFTSAARRLGLGGGFWVSKP